MYLLTDSKKLKNVTDPTPLPENHATSPKERTPRPQTPVQQFDYRERTPINDKIPSPQ